MAKQTITPGEWRTCGELVVTKKASGATGLIAKGCSPKDAQAIAAVPHNLDKFRQILALIAPVTFGEPMDGQKLAELIYRIDDCCTTALRRAGQID